MGCNLRAAPKSNEVSKSVTSFVVINAGNAEQHSAITFSAAGVGRMTANMQVLDVAQYCNRLFGNCT